MGNMIELGKFKEFISEPSELELYKAKEELANWARELIMRGDFIYKQTGLQNEDPILPRYTLGLRFGVYEKEE